MSLKIFSAVSICLLSSCNVLYYPTSHNSPMFSNKGEVQATGVISSGNLEVQTAYAITDNIGIMLNGSWFSEQKDIEIGGITEKKNLKRNLLEAGAGYFVNFSDIAKFEVFAGGGMGTVPANFRGVAFDGSQTATMTRFFIQPAIGLGTKVVDFSGTVRIAAVSMNNQTNTFAEPGLIIKVGYSSVRVFGNLGISIPMQNTNNFSWDHNPLIVGLGIHFNFGRDYD